MWKFGNLPQISRFPDFHISTFADFQMIQNVADCLFMPWGVGVLLLAGLWLSVRTAFVQVRRFGEAWRVAFVRQGTAAAGVLTPFQAFMTALGASIGTGNIAGVATAIVSGGPGALFWIWCYGFFATTIKFCEAVLGIRFRRADAQGLSAGPMHYLSDGLRLPRLGWLYAAIAGVAALTTTPFTQPNSIAVVWRSQFHVPTWVTGLILAALTWL